MKKLVRCLKKLNYRHYLCAIITIGSLLCTAFLFTNGINRIIESFCDFGLSIAYYFCELFYIDNNITVTVNALPSLNLFPITGSATVDIPETWENLKLSFVDYWQLWASSQNFAAYLSWLGNIIYWVCYALILVMPIFLIMFIVIRRVMSNPNNDYAKQSKSLKRFLKFRERVILPVKAWIKAYIQFIKEHKYYWITWLCIWCLNFNLFTIFVEFLAYYFYFCISFDFTSLYMQFYKLIVDLATPVNFIPWYIWLAIGLIIFDIVRKHIAYGRLNHFERRNCGFINERPIVTMVVGTMGKGKTTMLTDMCLSTEVMFRDKAFEKILENDLKFPDFPWINFENELKRAVKYHKVYNLATCRHWVRLKYSRWYKQPCYAKCFGYDYDKFPFTYDNKLNVVTVWDVLEIYAQLYFIYVMESSLLMSNYSIRSDVLLSDLGNFPLWNGDFFKRDSRMQEAYSRHAHILDFDMLRLGKTLVEENKQTNAFEFGVVAISEIGKERRNALETRELKKLASDTNQKNDGFNDGLKMRRHSATVDNYSFIKIISDEQRPESLGADARDMFDIVYIRDRCDTSLAMPFFSLEELLYGWLFRKFCNFYSNYRYKRGDYTLLMYMLKGVTAKLNHYYTRIYNRFGFNVLKVQVENGTLDGDRKDGKYFLSWKKIYSNRFSTDCMAAFWEERSVKSPVGLNDIDEYATSRASWDELKAQHSYFVRDTLLMSINKNATVSGSVP